MSPLSRGATRMWTRRAWLERHATALAAVPLAVPLAPVIPHSAPAPRLRRGAPPLAAVRDAQTARLDVAPVAALATRAVEAAVAAGATYADARLTRTLVHVSGVVPALDLRLDTDTLGIGVRALVNGYWGVASSTLWAPDEAARLGQEAVAIATVNAQGPRWAVDLGRVPVAKGRWATPIEIDPFDVPIQETWDTTNYWCNCAARLGLQINPAASYLQCVRTERVLATSDGALVAQTTYETGGVIQVGMGDPRVPALPLRDVAVTGRGWEVFREADIPTQLESMPELLRANAALQAQGRPATIGQYTLVCDGETMAALTEHTLGLATQLDRALGYEANAGGTSYLGSDPLDLVGQEAVASPLVTLTADRSMPGGLATVKWDDEGVEPDTATLVKDGVLTDFQTTRESAGWLAAYYQKAGRPGRSHGHAVGAPTGVTLQQMPNLALAPQAGGAKTVEALAASVPDGILVTQGQVRTDFQAKTGVLQGELRAIKRGRLGPPLVNGAILFGSADLWKKVTAVGGPETLMTLPASQYDNFGGVLGVSPLTAWRQKGQPPQLAGHSTRAPAAVITAQALIDPTRRA